MEISQGGVATQLRCDGIFNNDFIANLLVVESATERILKIS